MLTVSRATWLTLLAAGLAAVVAIASLSAAVIFRIDDASRDDARLRVAAAVTAERRAVAMMARDYAHWTEAHSAVARNDVAWLDANAGSSVYTTAVMDLAVYQAPALGLDVGWSSMVGRSPIRAPLEPGAAARARAALLSAEAGGDDSATLFVRSNDAVWLAAIARVAPVDAPADAARDDFFMIAGRLVDDAFVADLAHRLMLDSLRHAADHEGGVEALTLDAADAEAGRLVWTAPTPAADAFASIAPTLAVFGALFFGGLLGAVVWTGRAIRRVEGARDAAVDADRAKAAFLAGVSHELKTPLAGVMGVLQLLGAQDLTHRQKRLVEVARGSAASQLALIERLLEAGRLGSGRMTLSPRPVDVPSLLREIVEMMAPMAAAKGVALDLRAPDPSPRVMADALALRQIAQNLLANAVKFTDRGGVRARLAMQADGDRVRLLLTVADDGPGVPPEERERIFLPFAQAAAALAREKGGAGLGLSIVRGLAEMMDGSVEVGDGAGGRGAVFTVALRLARAPDAQLGAAA